MEFDLFLYTLLLCNVIISESCPLTFQNTPVLIGKNKIVKVTGCINSSSLQYGNETSLVVVVKDQRIPSLNTGAVSNIDVHLSIKIIHNRIDSIKEAAFVNLSRLEDLYLDYNHLTSIESKAFENLPFLQSIYIQNNNLKVLLSDTFVNLPNLYMVYLNNNNLEIFNHNWFAHTPLLTRIILNNNQISFIDFSAFKDLELLESIAFRKNKLQYIHPKAFHGLKKLLELDLAYNQLTSFEVKLESSLLLHRIGLDHNRLTYISMSTLKEVQYSLSTLYIQSNPLQCSCVDELVLWAMKHDVSVFLKCEDRDLYCVLPLSDETDCVERSLSEFNVTTFAAFERDCLIMR